MYNRPLHEGNWASLLLWGHNQSLHDGNVGEGYLLESTLKFLSRNCPWMRIENADRTNELLLRTPCRRVLWSGIAVGFRLIRLGTTAKSGTSHAFQQH